MRAFFCPLTSSQVALSVCTAPCVPPATPDPQAVVPFENLDNWPLGTVPLAKPLVTTASLSGSKRTQWLVATNFAFTGWLGLSCFFHVAHRVRLQRVTGLWPTGP